GCRGPTKHDHLTVRRVAGVVTPDRQGRELDLPGPVAVHHPELDWVLRFATEDDLRTVRRVAGHPVGTLTLGRGRENDFVRPIRVRGHDLTICEKQLRPVR